MIANTDFVSPSLFSLGLIKHRTMLETLGKRHKEKKRMHCCDLAKQSYFSIPALNEKVYIILPSLINSCNTTRQINTKTNEDKHLFCFQALNTPLYSIELHASVEIIMGNTVLSLTTRVT